MSTWDLEFFVVLLFQHLDKQATARPLLDVLSLWFLSLFPPTPTQAEHHRRNSLGPNQHGSKADHDSRETPTRTTFKQIPKMYVDFGASAHRISTWC